MPITCSIRIAFHVIADMNRSSLLRLFQLGRGSTEKFLNLAVDGFRPNVVALGGEMEGVVHDFLADGVVGFEELGADVHVVDRPPLEFRDQFIDSCNFFAAGIRFLATGEYAQQQYLGLRLFGLDQVEDRLHTCRHIRGLGLFIP